MYGRGMGAVYSDINTYCAQETGITDPILQAISPTFQVCKGRGGTTGTVPPPYNPQMQAPGLPVGYDPATGQVIGDTSQVVMTSPQEIGVYSSQNTQMPSQTFGDQIYSASVDFGSWLSKYGLLILGGVLVVGMMVMQGKR